MLFFLSLPISTASFNSLICEPEKLCPSFNFCNVSLISGNLELITFHLFPLVSTPLAAASKSRFTVLNSESIDALR